jgi:molecular chaperone HscB
VSESSLPLAGDTLSLLADDFTLLGVPVGFAQDRAVLDERWKQLQRQVHPDRFATDTAAAQRLAMQWSVRINEAYQRLKDPLKRAAYWCERQGTPVNAESNTAMPAAFLMQQMEWREALDEAADEATLEALLADTRQARQGLLDGLEDSIDHRRDAAQAVQQVRALMFVERFADEVRQRLDRF